MPKVAAPFPTNWDPSTDGFGPMYEGDAPGAMRKALRGAQRPKRKGFAGWWIGTTVKTAVVIATVVMLWKLTSMFIVWVHPWP